MAHWTDEQKAAFAFAFTADRTMHEKLAIGDMQAFAVWQRMRDEAIAQCGLPAMAICQAATERLNEKYRAMRK